MAKLESEAMLLGIWKTFQELEEVITVDELQALLEAAHEAEHRRNKFTAAMKGIDLDNVNKESAQDRFDAVQHRVNARLSGKSEDELTFEDMGFDLEIE